MADELLDGYDDGLRPLGPIDRGLVHQDGVWHGVFHCLAVLVGTPPRVLLQRRPSTARSFAGLLDLTTTGHLVAGEAATDGVRELEEEVGIVATADDLVPLGRRLLVDDSGEGRNREIVHAFLLPLDRQLSSFDLTGCDVDGLIEIELASFLRILGDADASSPATEIDGHGWTREITVGQRDLVPATDGYWTVLAIMAQRLALGETPLAI